MVIVMAMMMVMAVMINLVMSYLLSLTLDVSLEPTSSPCCCWWLFSTLAQESENHEPHDTMVFCIAQFVQLAKDTIYVLLDTMVFRPCTNCT